MLREIVRRVPLLGPAARYVKHRLVGEPLDYTFIWESPSDDLDRLRNLLEYTKTSGSQYSAKQFPAGYHTLRLEGTELRGQRDPHTRLAPIQNRFLGKSVLDIGCNQGGMLFEIRDVIAHGVGVDYDRRTINAATRIRSLVGAAHLDFYVFDLERDPLALLSDLLPGGRVDVVFLLSVAMWIENWGAVLDTAVTLADEMLFESNGTDEQQAEQEQYLRRRFRDVELLAAASDDDPGQKRRRLFYARHPIRGATRPPDLVEVQERERLVAEPIGRIDVDVSTDRQPGAEVCGIAEADTQRGRNLGHSSHGQAIRGNRRPLLNGRLSLR